ncbi:MAG: ABC transporter permease [Nitrososphaerales archaeon]
MATNDFETFRRKKYTLYSLIGLPFVLSVGLPIVVWLWLKNGEIPTSEITVLLNAFSFFFIILATLIPTVLTSYSFLGEKLEKSLEPLLATPATDGELLLGKSLAALLPSIGVSYLGAAIFMVFVDELTYGRLGYLYFPNLTMAVILLLAVPLACTFSVEANVIIASLVGDLRAAQQLGTLASVPFGGVFVLAETNFSSLNSTTLLTISVLLLAIDVVLLQVCRSTFRREEILTKWK